MSRRPATAAQRGVYFLANDRTSDLAITFLNSFRRFNDTIPLCLIPFDDRCDRIASLSAKYCFDVFDDAHLLQQCDRWSQCFHQRASGQYRKLAMWSGPYEQFLYIDIDTVVLADLSFSLDYLRQFDVLTSHSNLPGCRRYVWQPDFESDLGLTEQERSYAANTGFIVSKRGLLAPKFIADHIGRAAERKHAFELMCMEQPLLNYLLLHATQRYTSLSVLRSLLPDRDIPHECWPGDPNWQVDLAGNATYRGEPKRLMFIHWAGQWSHLGIKRRILDGLFSLRLGNPSAIRRDMKMGDIWRHYRDLAPPAPLAPVAPEQMPSVA